MLLKKRKTQNTRLRRMTTVKNIANVIFFPLFPTKTAIILHHFISFDSIQLALVVGGWSSCQILCQS